MISKLGAHSDSQVGIQRRPVYTCLLLRNMASLLDLSNEGPRGLPWYALALSGALNLAPSFSQRPEILFRVTIAHPWTIVMDS